MYSSHQARETHIQKRACPSASAAVLSPTPWFYLYLITLHDLIIYSVILSPTPWFYHYLITYSMILSPTPWFYHYLITYSMILSLTPFYHLQWQQVQMQEKGCSSGTHICTWHNSLTLQSPQPQRKKVVGKGVWKGEACSFFLLLHFNSMPTQVHNRVGKVWVVNKTSDSDMTSKYHNAQTV